MFDRRDRLCGPKNDSNEGPAAHPGNTIPVIRKLLPSLAINTPPGKNISGSLEGFIRDPDLSEGEYSNPPSATILLVPTTIKPPCIQKIVNHGGKRCYGGGTSKDAIRRARKQEKRKNKK